MLFLAVIDLILFNYNLYKFYYFFLIKKINCNIMFSVKDTNLEALRAKKSAVLKGYMED